MDFDDYDNENIPDFDDLGNMLGNILGDVTKEMLAFHAMKADLFSRVDIETFFIFSIETLEIDTIEQYKYWHKRMEFEVNDLEDDMQGIAKYRTDFISKLNMILGSKPSDGKEVTLAIATVCNELTPAEINNGNQDDYNLFMTTKMREFMLDILKNHWHNWQTKHETNDNN